jgi:hypothetical protein
MRVKLRRSKAAAALSLLLLAPLAGCPQEPDEKLDHGVVWLQLLRGDSQADNPYLGTARIQITLLYRECLIDFYAANPDYEQNGVEGSLVFGTREDGGEGWLDRLCESPNPNRVDCTVESFRQELSTSKQLTVNYAINGNPEHREIPFGPIPKAELAECSAGDQPIVRVGSNGSVRGLDANGNTLWQTESFVPSEAATDQGGRIKISAARSSN